MGIRKEISQLEKELNSVVVLQEEKRHEESWMPDTTGDYASRWWSEESRKIIDKPAVTEPDVEKRRKARTKLINLKYSLRFYQYATKWRIEEILLKPKSRDESELEFIYDEIDNLRKGLSVEKVVQEAGREMVSTLQSSGWDCASIYAFGYNSEEVIEPEITAPDTEKREASKKALEEIYYKTKYVTAKRKIKEVLGYTPGERQEDGKR